MSKISSLGWRSFSLIAVYICWQLLTADDSCYEKKLNKIFINTLKVIYVPHFSSLAWFSFWSAVNSGCQILTAIDSWWQLFMKKYKWNFHLHPKNDICAKFQLSRLIFVFISCWQLFTTVDRWWQLLWKKFKWNFYIHS